MLTKPSVPYDLCVAFSVITNLRMELFQALSCTVTLTLSMLSGRGTAGAWYWLLVATMRTVYDLCHIFSV